MRILILGMNYLPESVSIGPYVAGLAEYLCERGHRVQVVTSFPQPPQLRIWDGYRGKLFMHEAINGIPTLRAPLTFLGGRAKRWAGFHMMCLSRCQLC